MRVHIVRSKLSVLGIFSDRLNVRPAPEIGRMHVMKISIAKPVEHFAVETNVLPRPIARSNLVEAVQMIGRKRRGKPCSERAVVRNVPLSARKRPTLSRILAKIARCLAFE